MSSEGIELQHRGKPANVSYEASESSPEDQSGRTGNNPESSKVHIRQLDVNEPFSLIHRNHAHELPEIYQLPAYRCV
jgi:hypothetical protein